VRRRAQAVVEAALVLPLLITLVFGAIGVGRVVQARMALDAATREAARTTAVATMPRVGAHDQRARDDAEAAGKAQGVQVAQGNGLRNAEISVNAEGFGPGSWVVAHGTYTVSEVDLPFMRQVFASVLHGRGIELQSYHLERIDRYRSLSP
jgi:Flp pilus assembly protein TadG